MGIANQTVDTLKKMFAEGKRFDGRGLLDLRPVSVTFDVSNNAEGSARVRIGKTEVVAGVKLAPGTPYPDSLDKGNISVSGDLLPLASPRFEMGPPKFAAVELPRLVDRAVRESGMIDLTKLVIKEGEKVWTVFIDIYPINDDGSLVDAATMAAVIALRHAKVPALTESGTVDYDKSAVGPLPVSKETVPFTFTFFKLGKSILLDPTREEEEACEAKIAFGISMWNKQHMINSCQKGGEMTFSAAEIEQMMSILPGKFDELNEKLKSAL
jgi:exosome complex component RRP42